jgi:hypothetical protein
LSLELVNLSTDDAQLTNRRVWVLEISDMGILLARDQVGLDPTDLLDASMKEAVEESGLSLPQVVDEMNRLAAVAGIDVRVTVITAIWCIKHHIRRVDVLSHLLSMPGITGSE